MIAQIGEIQVTSTTVRTPAGQFPLRGCTWTVTDQWVATQKIPKTIPFLIPGDETFDVGVDTRTPVNDQDYQVPFAFNGTIDNVTFKLGPVRLSAAEQRQLNRMVALGAE